MDCNALRAARRCAVTLAFALSLPALAHAASSGPCPPQPAPAPVPASASAQASGDAPFDWTLLPAVPAAQAPDAYRIAVWGDSLTSARMFMDAALAGSGIDKRDVQPGFIVAGLQVPGLALPLKWACASGGWTTAYAYREKGNMPAFSQGLLRMTSASPGDAVALDFRFPQPGARVRQLDILYDKPRPDGSLLLGVTVDGQPEKLVPLSRARARVLRIVPRVPLASVRIRLVSGEIRLHGFQPHYQEAPRVVLDTLSIPGATLRGWQFVDERLLPGAPGKPRDYDLILVQYGTNEGAAPAFDAAGYALYLDSHLARLRRLHPEAHCILIGPPDRGVAGGQGADPMKYAAIHHQIALTQRKISPRYGCSFWDWQGEIGGPGTAVRWLHADPPLMQPDLTHMTAPGYQASGRLFSRSYPIPTRKP